MKKKSVYIGYYYIVCNFEVVGALIVRPYSYFTRKIKQKFPKKNNIQLPHIKWENGTWFNKNASQPSVWND